MNTLTAPAQIPNLKPASAPRAATKAKPAVGPRAPEPIAPAKKTPKSTPLPKKQNCIIAHVNVGWGNAVYLRGVGGDLSWDVGVPMACVAEDQWVWFYPENCAPHEIKFVRNDTDWALGENHVVLPREILAYAPQFPPR